MLNNLPMNNKTKAFATIFMFLAVLLSAFFLYSNLQKRFNHFTQKIESDVESASYFLLRTYEHNISTLELLKSDTLDSVVENDLYQTMVGNGETSWTGHAFFSLLKDLYYNEKNTDDLIRIGNEYTNQLHKLRESYIFIHDASALKKAEIDTLISYNKNLLATIEQVRKMKIVP